MPTDVIETGRIRMNREDVRAPLRDELDRTKARIVEVAETFFAEEGYEGAKIRTIAEAASVNIAAVNYHFGTKNNLFETVFARRVVPMNEDRLRRLDAALAVSKPPSLASIVDAFVRPPLSTGAMEDDASRIVQMKFLSRAFSLPDEETLLKSYYRDVRTRFLDALHSALPELEFDLLILRYNLMVGALIYALGGSERMMRLPEGLNGQRPASALQMDMLIEQISKFCVAGFRA